MVKGDNERSFYWDGNVAAMSEKDELHYYLQDELGSPVRVSGYDTTYLTYGYDEFGNDLYHELEEANIPNPYNRQGEYQPESGRFTAEDVIKGSGAFPETLNRYGYCWGNPVMLVDLDGKLPYFPTMTGPIWSETIISGIQDTYDSWLEEYENSLVGAPQLPEISDDLPDYTEEINAFMDRKVTEFRDMGVIEQYKEFYKQVRTGGKMDIKVEETWNNTFNTETTPYVDAFIFNGEVVNPSIFGNMTYAYLGKSLSIPVPDILLYYGGGWAHMKNVTKSNIGGFKCLIMPNYGDAPEDHGYIEDGIKWYWSVKLSEILDTLMKGIREVEKCPMLL